MHVRCFLNAIALQIRAKKTVGIEPFAFLLHKAKTFSAFKSSLLSSSAAQKLVDI
jgi:hypothetical protein